MLCPPILTVVPVEQAVACGVKIADQGAGAHDLWGGGARCRRKGVARDKIEHAGRGRPKGRPIGIVVHREMLSVIPNGRDGVAIKIAHRQTLIVAIREGGGAERAGAFPDAGGEQIHQPLVEGFLFVAVIMILVAGRCL